MQKRRSVVIALEAVIWSIGVVVIMKMDEERKKIRDYSVSIMLELIL